MRRLDEMVRQTLLLVVMCLCGKVFADELPNFASYRKVQACVEPVHITKAGTAALDVSRSSGPVRVIEYAGAYDRGLSGPRSEVASSIIEATGEDVDFIVAFTGFEYETGDALAFYNRIKNEVRGIGQDQLDYSAQFGSRGRLHGYIDMAATSRYTFDVREPSFRNVLNTLAHEIMHRWGVYARYTDAAGVVKNDLFGRDGSHWNLLADTSASLMYGAKWQQDADGTYRIVEARERFSRWDLYLAGLADASEVPPMRLLRGSPLSPNELPIIGMQTQATPEIIDISQVVLAEGARDPQAQAAQREFTATMVLLVRPGTVVTDAQLAELQRFSARFESYFQSVTEGRASIRFTNGLLAEAHTGTPPPLTGSPLQQHQDPVAAGVAWLKAQQRDDGSFSDRSASTVRDTIATRNAIIQVEPHWSGAELVRGYLESQDARNEDERVRLAVAISDGTPVQPAYALAGNWVHGVFDLAMSAALDADAMVYSSTARESLLQELVESQSESGGFASIGDGAARLRASLNATRAMLAYFPQGSSLADRARAWVLDHLLELPLQGAQSASTSELADALMLAGELDLPETMRLRFSHALAARQGVAGDWEGSVYTTAVASQALARLGQPDLQVVSASLSPEQPVVGAPVVLRALVRNGGGSVSPGVAFQWHSINSDGSETVIRREELPSLLPGESVRMEFTWDAPTSSMDSRLRITLDPDEVVVETNEENNSAELALTLAPGPEGVDLAVFTSDLDMGTQNFTVIGEAIQLRGVVRNLGTVPVQQIPVRLHRLQSTGTTVLGEALVDVGPGARSEFAIAFPIHEQGNHELRLTVDPDAVSADIDRSNNDATLILEAAPGIDLKVLSETLELQPDVAKLGVEHTIRVTTRNLGRDLADDIEVELRSLTTQGAASIQRRIVSLSGGASATSEFNWTPQELGDQNLQIVIDPNNGIDEHDETNNNVAFNVRVEASPGVDLFVAPGSSLADPVEPLQGNALHVSADIGNHGTQEVSGYTLGLYLGDPRAGGVRLTSQPGPSLTPSETSSVLLSVDEFPARGDVSLFVVVDSEQMIAEADENNNFGIIDTIALARPDLAVSQQSISLEPENPVGGFPVRLVAHVQNLGEQPSTPVQAHLYQIRDGETQTVATNFEVPVVQPGGGTDIVWEWQLDAAPTDALQVTIDPEFASQDGDRRNNEVTLPLVSSVDSTFALMPYFSPNGDGVRDSTAVLVPVPSSDIRRVDVEASDGALIAKIELVESLSPQLSMVRWDGLDEFARTAPDGTYRLRAVGQNEATMGQTWVVLDTDHPMALASVVRGEVVTRTLSPSAAPWVAAPSGSLVEDYLYTFGNEGPPASVLPRGILRTHAFMGGVESVVSARWLDNNAPGYEIGSMLIDPFTGREIVFTLNGSVWVQDANTVDHPRLIATLPLDSRRAAIVDFAGERHVLLREGSEPLIALDLESGELRTLAASDNQEILEAYSSGVLLGRREDMYPVRYIPFDPGAPEIDFDQILSETNERYRRAELIGNSAAIFLHSVGASGERIQRIDLLSGNARAIFTGPAERPDVYSGGGYLQVNLTWLNEIDRAVLIDHANVQVRLIDGGGSAVLERQFAGTGRQGEYAFDYQYFMYADELTVVKGEPFENVTSNCPSPRFTTVNQRRLDKWQERWRSNYDPHNDVIYFSSGEVVLPRTSLFGGGYDAACAGATDYFRLSLRNGDLERIDGRTAWSLISDEDAARYPRLQDVLDVELPAAWPRFFQLGGVHLRQDGRIAVDVSGSSAWPRATQLQAAIHEETRLLLAEDAVAPNRVITSLERLRAELRASSNGRSVTFTGFATDADIDYYQIDYSRSDSPETWLSVVPPRREQVIGSEFLTWAPPQSGPYLFRLRVVDRAGNRKESFASAELVFSSAITNVRLDHRAISPNGDDAKDRARLEFSVSRPTEATLNVFDALGQMVYSEPRSFGADNLGEQSWEWSGQSDAGTVVGDGQYRIELAPGFGYPVSVDTTFPTLNSPPTLSTYSPGSEMVGFSGAYDYRGVENITADLKVSLESRLSSDTNWFADQVGILFGCGSPCIELGGKAKPDWLSLFDRQYRWVFEDEAGNRLVREIPQAEPITVLLGAVADAGPTRDSFGVLPDASSRISRIAAHRFAVDLGNTAILPITSVPVYFRSDHEDPRSVVLDIARTAGTSDPMDAPVVWQTLQESMPTSLGDGRFEIDADFSGLAPGEIVGLRVRERVGNAVRTSNAMRFGSPSAELVCNEFPQSISLGLHNFPYPVEEAGLVFVGQVPAQPLHGHGSYDLEDNSFYSTIPGRNDVGAVSAIVVQFLEPHKEFRFLHQIPVSIVACGDGGDGGSGEFVEMDIRTAPVVGACGVPPAGKILAIGTLPPEAVRFSLELTDPRFGAPVVIASGNAAQFSVAGYEISTVGLPGVEGHVVLRADLADGRQFSKSSAFPLDFTPPAVGFSAPAPGSRVCNVDGMGLDGFVATDTAAIHMLEVASLDAGAIPRFAPIRCNGRVLSGACIPVLDGLNGAAFREASPQRSFSGSVLDLPDEDVPSGSVSFRLRAMDWSGAQVCTELSVHVDSEVGLRERRAATPSPVVTGPMVISAEGSEDYRVARWYFQADEELELRAELFATTPAGPSVGSGFLVDGPALAVIWQGTDVVGEVDLQWDGRLQGQNAEDGVYALRVQASDACGHEKEILNFVRVDSHAPALTITQPSEMSELRGAAVQVIGTVMDALPDEYVLSISSGGPQGPWQEVSRGRGAVSTPRPLGAFQTLGVTGNLWIQLNAQDRVGNASSLVRQIVLLPRPDILASARLSRAMISPNDDGRLDSLEVQLVLLREALLDVDLIDLQGQVRATLAQSQPVSPGAFSLPWGLVFDPTTTPDGSYRMRIRAHDAELGGTPDEAELDFVIDTVPPELDWSPTLPTLRNCSAAFELDVRDRLLSEFFAELRNSAGERVREFAGLTESTNAFSDIDQLPDGEYQIIAQALDAAGNRSEANGGLTLDCSAPEVSLTSPAAESVLPSGPGSVNRIHGSVTDAHPSSYRLTLISTSNPSDRRLVLESSGGAPDGFDYDWTPPVLDGAYRLELSAIDQADNLGTTMSDLVLDGTPPLAIIHSPVDDAVVKSNLVLSVTASDLNLESVQLFSATPSEAARDQWSLLYASNEPLQEGDLPALQGMPQGERVFRLHVRDRAGHSAHADRRLLLDSEPPPAPIELAGVLEPGGQVRLSWSGGDAPDLAGFFVYRLADSLRERVNVNALLERRYLDLLAPEGDWTYEVTAVDAVGNESGPSNPIPMHIDRTPPQTSIADPTEGERVHGTLPVRGTASAASDFARYELALLGDNGEFRRVLRESAQAVSVGVLGEWDTRTEVLDSTARLRLRAWDQTGNRAEILRSVVVDNLPPAAPQGLMGELQGANVELTWQPNSEPDLLGYLLYRNGRLLTGGATLPADLRVLAWMENAYPDQNVPDGELIYRVYAIDQAGNISPPSAPYSLQVEQGPPSAEIVRPDDGTTFDNAIELVAQTEHQDVTQMMFSLRAVGSQSWNVVGEPVSSPPWRQLLDPEGLSYGDYEIQVVATDRGGLVDPQPPRVRITHADITAPEAPEGLLGRSHGTTVELAWSASTAPDLDRYLIERYDNAQGWIEIGSRGQGIQSAVDTNRPLGSHRYRLLARDRSGNDSGPSDEIEVPVFAVDIHPEPYTPSADQQLNLSGSSPRAGELQVEREVDGESYAFPSLAIDANVPFEADLALVPGRNLFLTSVLDNVGNTSVATELVVTHGLRPESPTGLTGTVDIDEVTLQWETRADVAGYRVYRNDVPLLADVPMTQTLTASVGASNVPQLVDGDPATVWFEQTAANSDQLSRALEVRWMGPVLVGGMQLQWQSAEQSARDFDVYGWYDERWNLLTEIRNQGGASYLLELPTAYPTNALRLVPRRAQAQGARHALAEVSVRIRALQHQGAWSERVSQGQHRYRVAAVSFLGFEGERSAEWVAAVGDSTSPTAVVLNGSLQGRDANLTWTGSEAADLRRYVVYRDGQTVAEVNAGAERRFLDVGLPNGSHRYVVRVEDLFGNLSPPSNELELIVDIAGDAPGVPQITAAITQLDAPAVEVHWHAAEGATPARYRLYMSAHEQDPDQPYVEVARPAASPWMHTGLSYGQRLYYRVQAEDAAGNLSGLSAPFPAEVRDLRTPTAPTISYPAPAPDFIYWDQARYQVCGMAQPSRRVEVRVNGEVRDDVVAAPSSLPLSIVDSGDLLISEIAISPDGQRLAWIGYNGEVHEHDLTSGTTRVVPADIRRALQYSADGLQLQGIGSSDLWLSWSESTGSQTATLLYGVRDAVKFPGYGGWLATRFESLYWVPYENAYPQLIGAPREVATSSRMLPMADGSGAYLLATSGNVYEWLRDAPSVHLVTMGKPVVRLHVAPVGQSALALTRDGVDSEIWRIAHGAVARVIAVPGTFDDFAIAPDGKTIWLLSAEELVRHDLETGEQLEVLSLSRSANRMMGSRTGTLVAASIGEYDDPAVMLQPVLTAGAYCSEALSAELGSNRIETVAVSETGVRSAPSAELNLVYQVATLLPDLVVDAAGIRLLPTPGVAGQPHTLVFELRNTSYYVAVPSADVRVELTDPNGNTVRYDRTISLPLAGQALLAVPVGLLQAGEYRVEVSLDRESQIEEADESNNQAQMTFLIGASAAPQLTLAVERAVLPPDEPFEGSVSMNVAGNFSGRVDLWISDPAGVLVENLPSIDTGQVSSVAPWSRAWRWSPLPELLAGNYQLHARLLDEAGQLQSEQTLDLSIEARVELALSLQASAPEVLIGQTLGVEFGMAVLHSNVLLDGGQLRLTVSTADGGDEVLWSGTSGVLSEGYQLRRTRNWSTAGQAAGQRELRLQFVAPGLDRQLTRTVNLVSVQPTSGLYGELALQPSSSLILGQPTQLTYRVGNRGGAALNAVPIRVHVQRDVGLPPILAEQQVVDLGAGEARSFALDLVALPQQPASWLVTLEAETADGWRSLAHMGLQSIDSEAPLGDLLAPIEQVPVRTPSRIETSIRDRHSSVASAEFSVDGGAWRSLAGSGGVYTSVLSSLVDGEHQLSLRAQDTWGNLWQMAPRTVLVDNTAPTISVQGVAEGQYYAAAVSPTFHAEDPHLSELRAWDNAMPVESGSPLAVEGAHRLEVHATDAAGNRARREVNFVLDFTAPTLRIVAPVVDSQVATPTVEVELETEAGASVEVTVGAWHGVAQADVDGRVLMAAVPLQVGTNVIAAEAADRAGNRSLPVSVQVTRIDVAGELLGQLGMPGAALARGTDLDLQLAVHNETASPVDGESILRIQSADGSMLVDLHQATRLSAGESRNWSERFPTASWPLGAVSVQLQFADANGQIELAASSLDLLDRAVPVLTVRQPLNGALLSNPLAVQADASDDDALQTVRYRVDQGGWLPLAASQPPAFGITLDLPDGAHQLEIQAVDLSGNESTAPLINVVMDSTAPEIVIGGVADGGLYGEPVHPTVNVLDAHPGALDIRINGQPAISGEVLDESGHYQLSVRASDQLDQTTERSIVFELDLEPVTLQLDTPQEGAILSSDRVDLLGHTKPYATVSVQGPLSTHQVQADAEGNYRIDSVGLNSGANTLSLHATDRLGRISPELLRTVHVDTSGQDGLLGQLESAGEVAVNQPWNLRAIIRENVGRQRDALAARIVIERPEQSPFDVEWTTSLAALSEQVRELNPPAQSSLGPMTIRLLVQVNGAWIELAQRQLRVVDRTPPEVSYLAPAVDSYHRAEIPLQVQAQDAHGDVVSVQARVDGGAWTELQRQAVASTTWAGTLLPTVEGVVSLQLRAMDAAQNVSLVTERRVVFDTTRPQIEISGVEANGLYRESVQAIVSTTDASPVSLQLTLDGQAYASGQWIEGHGQHTLAARAVDAAGNATDLSLSFAIDLLAPEVMIVAPAQGAVIRSGDVQVLGNTEPMATLQLRAGDYADSQTADAKGLFRFDHVPLRIGMNQVEVRASDRAGNVGPWAVVDVERRGGFALRGLLQVPPQVEQGEELPVSVLVGNDASHPQPEIRLRLLAEDAEGETHVLDERSHDFAGGEEYRYVIDPDTSDWPTGIVTLRLLATDEVEVQLADARLTLLAPIGPPPQVVPRPIPFEQNWSLVLLTALMAWFAAWRLRRVEE